MSYHYVCTTNAAKALEVLAPNGVKAEDCERKLLATIKAALNQITFDEVESKKGAKAKRLKIDPKKMVAKYSTSMAGDYSKLPISKHLEAYGWLWDVCEFEQKWGQEAIASLRAPLEIVDWLIELFDGMKPATEKKKEGEEEKEKEPANA